MDAPTQHETEGEETACNDPECDFAWGRVGYPSEAEARAFADGLTYGDEPLYEVDEVAPCLYEEGKFDVVFRYREG